MKNAGLLLIVTLASGCAPAAAGEEEVAAAQRFLLDLQEAGAAIKRNIRRGAEKVRHHDPELNKRLRALGYLQ